MTELQKQLDIDSKWLSEILETVNESVCNKLDRQTIQSMGYDLLSVVLEGN